MTREPLPYQISYSEFGRVLVPASSGYSSVRGTLQATGTAFTGGSEDLHGQYDIGKLRDVSRAFDRSNLIYRTLIDRLLDMLLGDGLTVQAATGDTELNKQIESLWMEWFDFADIRGLAADSNELVRMWLRQAFVDGDVGILRVGKAHKAQTIPAERIGSSLTANPDTKYRIIDGVEIDTDGKPVAYWVLDYTANGFLQRGKGRRIPATDMDMVAIRRRNDQTRGEPLLQAVFPMLHRFNDICDSEAAAWQLLARFAILVNKKDAAAAVDALTTPNTDATSAGDIPQRTLNVGDAMFFFAERDETLAGIKRDLPGPNFTDSAKMFLRLICMAVGMPLEFILMIWSDTNYSSARAASVHARRSGRRWLNLIKIAVGNLYKWQLERIAEELPISAEKSPNFYRFTIQDSPYPMLDEQKETAANDQSMQSGQRLWSDVVIRNGDDPEIQLDRKFTELDDWAGRLDAYNAAHPTQPITISQVYPGLRANIATPISLNETPAQTTTATDSTSPAGGGE